MAGDFIPFRPGAKAPAGGSSGAFSPIGTTAAPGGSPTAVFGAKPAAGGPAAHAHGEVQIELKRDGERVSQIRIQCRCGELIELDCEY